MGQLSLLGVQSLNAEEIYHAYPRHVGKRDAIRAIEKALKRLPEESKELAALPENVRFDWLLRKVFEYAESEAGQKGVYTPHPATWFNRSSYLDEYGEWGGQVNGQCREHPDSGRTQWGTCWACYQRKFEHQPTEDIS